MVLHALLGQITQACAAPSPGDCAQVTESPSTARLDEPCGSETGLLAHRSRQLGPGDWDEVILPASCQLCLQLPLGGTPHNGGGCGADDSLGVPGGGGAGAELGQGGGCVWMSGAGRAGGVTCWQVLEAVHAFYQVTAALNLRRLACRWGMQSSCWSARHLSWAVGLQAPECGSGRSMMCARGLQFLQGEGCAHACMLRRGRAAPLAGPCMQPRKTTLF